MKKANKEGTFGAPKPLPGQPGYKLSDNDVLEKETREMEARLQILQEKMKQQQTDNESTSSKSSSGSRWKASNVEKGSIRAYGKDVLDKFKKKGEMIESGQYTLKPKARETEISSSQKPLMSQSMPNKPLENFTTKNVLHWSVDDVADWLNYSHLSQYMDIFRENEIDGNNLLDLSLNDLDYLNITILGHRKTILRGIDDLREKHKVPSKKTNLSQKKPSSAATLIRSQSSSSMDFTSPSDSNVGAEVSVTKSVEITKKHWSQIDPLANNKVSHQGLIAVNAADDTIDERAEQLAFMAAVDEWRKSDGKVKIVKEGQKQKENEEDGDDVLGSMDAKAFLQSDLGIGGDGGLWRDPFSMNFNDSPPRSTQSKPKTASKNTNLFEGNFDEAQEHAEFVKAVEAWRKDSKSNPTNNNNNNSTKPKSGLEIQTSASEETNTLTSPNTVQTARELADMLAKQLEIEQQESEEKMKKQREEAQRKLFEANKALEIIRQTNKTIVQSQSSTVFDDEDDDINTIHKDSKAEPRSYQETKRNDTYESDSKQSFVNYIQSKDEKRQDKDDYPEPPSTVRITLVETQLGSPAKAEPQDLEGYCVVEYASDED